MSIEKRVSPNGSISYRVKVRVKGYPPETATFKRKTDAEHWRNRTIADIRENKHFPAAKAKKHTVSELIDKYLEHLKVKNPHRYSDVKPLLNWWKEHLKGMVLANFDGETALDGQRALLTRKKQRQDVDGQYRTLSTATVNRYMVALHTAIQFGVKPLKWLSSNPIDEVDKLKELPGRDRSLTKEEMDKLLAACKASKNPHLFTIVMIGISCGARRSEIQFMKWADVSEDTTRITLPKTKNGEVRSAHLTGIASEIVKRMREKRNASDYLFPSPKDPNRPIDFESAWRSALNTAEVKNFRFHDTRHTCASYLAENGASTLVLKEALGHKSLAMVQRYAHLTQQHTADVMKQMTEKRFSHVEI